MPERNLFQIFVSRLNKLSIPYMITGAVASIIYGEPRLTNDIDSVLDLSSDQIDFELLEARIKERTLTKEWQAAKNFKI